MVIMEAMIAMLMAVAMAAVAAQIELVGLGLTVRSKEELVGLEDILVKEEKVDIMGLEVVHLIMLLALIQAGVMELLVLAVRVEVLQVRITALVEIQVAV